MILGIDLGTTYSVGAYLDKDGQAKAIINSESETITPSVVFFESAESVVVGRVAKDNNCIYPKDVVSLVKNSMGKLGDTFETNYGTYTPEVISSFILKKIVSDANAYLKPEEPITDVVVTKPAYFTEPQIQATKDAVELAGLNCVALLNEPTAAGIYYATKTNLTKANILVYDLGGGTFDASIIQIHDGNIEVLGTSGLEKVGGSYFDAELVKNICDELQTKHGVDIYKDPAFVDVKQALFTDVEEAKIRLSSMQKTTIRVRTGSFTEMVEITREQFEKIVAKLYIKTERNIMKALQDAGITKDQLDKVILVGGSSKIPYIEDHLKAFLGIEPSKEVNPNEVVGLGAALYAKQITTMSEKKITDVCSHGIGIMAARKTGEPYHDILIKKNSKLPAEMENNYRITEDNQEKITIVIMEGDHEDLDYCTELGQLNVDLPSGLQHGTRIFIKLKLDESQLLHIFLRIPNAGVEKEISFQKNSNMSDAEIGRWKKKISKAQDSIDEKNGIKKFFKGIFGEKEPVKETKTVKQEEKKDKTKEIPKIIENAMQDVVGMIEVKEEMRDYKNLFERRAKVGITNDSPETADTCVAVLGTSGIGMTTAAEKVAQIIHTLGITSLDTPVVAEYEDIVKKDEQETVNAIQTLFQNAMDGVLIIDDFHRFYNDNDMAAGMVAINFLYKAYLDAQKRVILVVAGETEEITKIFEKKDKFARLFENFMIRMSNYTAVEYVQILHKRAYLKGVVVDPEADAELEKHLKGESKLPDFKQIYYLDYLLNEAISDLANKLSRKRHVKEEEYRILTLDNFVISSKEESLEELLAQLDALTGLKSVKEQVHELVANVENERKARAQGRDYNASTGNLHMLFLGNAGTGKTTVARIIGKIYRELGILPKGHTVEVTRSDLVSSNVGGSEENTKAKVLEALGGVLFIDEAYSICTGKDDIFGTQILNTLLPLIENYRNDFVVIMAGYTAEMTTFLGQNSGLSSRFNITLNFEDYTIDEMMTIFQNMAEKDSYLVEGRATEAIKNLILQKMRGLDFGNARGVRNIYESTIRRQKARINKLADWGSNEEKIIRQEDIDIDMEDVKSVDDYLAELNSYIGLSGVKEQVTGLVKLAAYNAMRKEAGEKEESVTLHMVFSGNPGTGKTTIARLMGTIYKSLGYLTNGDVIEVGKSDMVGKYVGDTPTMVNNLLRRAVGNVLFIDEAYSLNDGQYGKEAIDELIRGVENYRDNLVVILAGYTKEMNDLLSVNQGLRSRFKNIIIFDDYTPDELVEIFKKMTKHYSYDNTVINRAREVILQKSRELDFGNARGVRNIVDEVVRRHAIRVASLPDATSEIRNTLTLEDFAGSAQPMKSFDEILNELESMVGLESVKREVRSKVNMIIMNERRRKAGITEQQSDSMHMIFAGNPGTGKTTVARKIAEIYCALGLLPTANTVEVDREGLVAGYVGQTASKTMSVINSAIGGVLFIDEAYELSKGGENDFGGEAIDTLLKAMEDHRDNLLVILAGYTKQMESFLNMNPGLKSRFDTVIDFEDYSVDEMMQIFKGLCRGYVLGDGVEEKLREMFAIKKNTPNFGNAREVRNIWKRVKANMSTRQVMENTPDEELALIKTEDIF